MSSSPDHPSIHVLVVEDNHVLLRSFMGLIRANRMRVSSAPDGIAAVEAVANSMLQGQPFDVVLSDIAMPKMDGVGLLRALRTHDLDVPVVLITGQPALDSAVRAVELGAYRYLFKPVAPPDLIRTLRAAASLCRTARTQRAAATELGFDAWAPTDLAGSEALLAQAIRGLDVEFDAIVNLDHEVKALEAIVQCPGGAFPTRQTLLVTAQRLGRLPELEDAVRSRVVSALSHSPLPHPLFLEVGSAELEAGSLVERLSSLHPFARHLVLQLSDGYHGEALLRIREQLLPLRELGFRIAVGNLGSAYAGLSMFAQVEPDYIKFDRELAKDIHGSTTKQRLISSVVRLCKDLNVLVVAIGVTSAAEAATLAGLGVDLFQGPLFRGDGD